MTVIELKNALDKLLESTPNVANEEVFFYDTIYNLGDLYSFDEVEIEWDLNQEGRYICLE